jgi:hypothetical protein
VTDRERVDRLARRLALAEREPDEAFVARTRLALRARALAQAQAKERREQALLEVLAVAGLALAARQILPAGDEAMALLQPVAAAGGTIAAAWAAGWTLLAGWSRLQRPAAMDFE